MTAQRKIVEVNEDCEIIYSDGIIAPCEHRPPMKFSDCKPGYGPGRSCAKWDHYHLMGRRA